MKEDCMRKDGRWCKRKIFIIFFVGIMEYEIKFVLNLFN